MAEMRKGAVLGCKAVVSAAGSSSQSTEIFVEAVSRRNFETMRNRRTDLKRAGKVRAGAAKLLRVEDLGGKPGPLPDRRFPGAYDEVR